MYWTHKTDLISIFCVCIAVRAAVSLHSYSGAGKPPLYGDYEAQRHWQEITTNLPKGEWYINTTDNNLEYWGLDYPPLTAYHSYLMGLVGNEINTSYIELWNSRGFESPDHKSFMRTTVLIMDILLYLPACFYLIFSVEKLFTINRLTQINLGMIFAVTLYPGQMLIDNGHFQYNNISLGLAMLATASIVNNKHYVACLLFTLALNYKQMELYHALPFFVYLLKTCFSNKSYREGFVRFLQYSGIVLSTFFVIWLPWINSLSSVMNVVHRLFPLGRGVFEDKVANFWCALNVVYKLKTNLENTQMALLCLCTTLVAIIPINVNLFISKSGHQAFLLCLTNTAMAFFLFSFQVHEKSILLVILPALFLFNSKPLEIMFFLEVTTFSMYPLLMKDKLTIPYFSLCAIYYILIKLICLNNNPLKGTNNKLKSKWGRIQLFFTIIMNAILFSLHFAPIPQCYPFLWPLVIALFSCINFSLFFVYFCYCQFYCTYKE